MSHLCHIHFALTGSEIPFVFAAQTLPPSVSVAVTMVVFINTSSTSYKGIAQNADKTKRFPEGLSSTTPVHPDLDNSNEIHLECRYVGIWPLWHASRSVVITRRSFVVRVLAEEIPVFLV